MKPIIPIRVGISPNITSPKIIALTGSLSARIAALPVSKYESECVCRKYGQIDETKECKAIKKESLTGESFRMEMVLCQSVKKKSDIVIINNE